MSSSHLKDEIVISEKFTSLIGTRDNAFDSDSFDQVKFRPLTRKRSIRTKDFLEGVYNQLTRNSEILPDGCKYFKTTNDGAKILVMEQQPAIRTIMADIEIEPIIQKLKTTGKLEEYGFTNFTSTKKDDDANNEGYYQFQLSFPYVIQIISLNSLNQLKKIFTFFRIHPTTSLNDYLCLAPLYNIPSGQGMCLGGAQSFPSLLESVESVQDSFWLNIFNEDYIDNILKYLEHDEYKVHDYLTWMYYTKKDPMFVFNVNWIKHSKNIFGMIKQIEEGYTYITRSVNKNVPFSILNNIFNESHSSEDNSNPEEVNVCNSMVVDDKAIAIGDEVLYNNESFYLYSILSRHESVMMIESVELQDEDDSIIHLEYHEFAGGYKDPYEENQITNVEVSGKIINPGDIIKCTFDDLICYKKIEKLRIASDGEVEAIINNDHYLMNNIDFELFDLSNIKIKGEFITKDKKYIIISRMNSTSLLKKKDNVVFKEYSVSSDGNIMLKFVNEFDRYISIKYRDIDKIHSKYEFIDNECIKNVDVMYYFDRLLFNDNNDSSFDIIKNKGLYIDKTTDENIRNFLMNDDTFKFDKVLATILVENQTRLTIPGIAVDIDFKVGDSIVYADWETPENMLEISVIESFEYNKDNCNLYVHSKTSDGKSFKIKYIDFKNNYVSIGIIRKIYHSCMGWKSGDKIRSNTTGIANFPKKDVNEIIAFIVDGTTKYPMVLCSNLCTLWMNDKTINSFDYYSPVSPEWDKLVNCEINLDKIKWAHGDLYKHGENRMIKSIIKSNKSKMGMLSSYCSDTGGFDWNYDIDKYQLERFRRYGFITPRYTMSNPNSASNGYGINNYFGGYITSYNSSIEIRSEQLKEDF